MSAYIINSKGVCMTKEMRTDRETELENSLSIALDINDKYQRENKELKDEAKEKKDWKVTLSYDVRHNDTYLITDQTKEDAIYIAENKNQSSECICLKKVEDDIEDTDTTIKEVVFNSEKKEWFDKEKK